MQKLIALDRIVLEFCYNSFRKPNECGPVIAGLLFLCSPFLILRVAFRENDTHTHRRTHTHKSVRVDKWDPIIWVLPKYRVHSVERCFEAQETEKIELI